MRPSESNNSKTQEHDDMHLWLQDVENQKKILESILLKEDIIEANDDYKFINHSPNTIDYQTREKLSKTRNDIKNLSIAETKKTSFEIQIGKIEIEVPMYSGQYLQGICDAMLPWTFYDIIHRQYHKLRIHTGEGEGTIRCEGPIHEWYQTCPKCEQPYSTSITITADQREIKKITHKNTYDIDETMPPVLKYFADKISEDSGHVLIELKPKLYSVSGIIGQIKTYKGLFEHSHRGMICCAVITYDTNTKYDSILKAENIHLIRIERSESKVDDHQQTLSCM